MSSPAIAEPLTVKDILNALEKARHTNSSEWIFLRELRLGTGRGTHALQRVDAFALNCYPHHGMKRVCYEIKCSRADFLGELKQPLKRRIGMRYSNEFYFVTAGDFVSPSEIPAECGLIEIGRATPEEWKTRMRRHAGWFDYNAETSVYCTLIVPAPWRDTPGPTWQLTAAMMRNQLKDLSERPPVKSPQEKLSFD